MSLTCQLAQPLHREENMVWGFVVNTPNANTVRIHFFRFTTTVLPISRARRPTTHFHEFAVMCHQNAVKKSDSTVHNQGDLDALKRSLQHLHVRRTTFICLFFFSPTTPHHATPYKTIPHRTTPPVAILQSKPGEDREEARLACRHPYRNRYSWDVCRDMAEPSWSSFNVMSRSRGFCPTRKRPAWGE